MSKESDRFERIHELGAKRHPHSWFEANRKAASSAMGEGLLPERDRAAISAIVLAVLDYCGAP